MKKKAFKAAGVGLIAGLGLLFVGTDPASAQEGPTTGPQEAQSSAEGDGVLSGNSAAATIAIPIGVCGNAVGVGVAGGGGALGICELDLFSSGADPEGVVAGPQTAESNASGDGVLSGNSIAIPIAVPIDICGNAVGVGVGGLGLAGAVCEASLFSS
jgi:hypothetical protein